MIKNRSHRPKNENVSHAAQKREESYEIYGLMHLRMLGLLEEMRLIRK
jgi:hypothetical protein